MSDRGKVAIVGSGLIGSCWAAMFASSGYSVCLYDVGDAQLRKARENVLANLRRMEADGLSRGSLRADEAIALVTMTTALSDALHGAMYVQESTGESVEFKTKIFAEMDAAATEGTILASSTSTIPASEFTQHLKHRSSCLVVHPVNPPLYLTLTEIVPAPWTEQAVVERACEIMKSIGQSSICLKQEVPGFAVNRLQYALLAEAWKLIKHDVLSVEDIDKVMSEGLGPRYAFYGPFGVIHLNAAGGVRDYCSRYMAGVRHVLGWPDEPSARQQQFDEPEVIDALADSLEKSMPVHRMAEHTAERANKLAELAKLKRKLKKD